jgi:hypothetical protein
MLSSLERAGRFGRATQEAATIGRYGGPAVKPVIAYRLLVPGSCVVYLEHENRASMFLGNVGLSTSNQIFEKLNI